VNASATQSVTLTSSGTSPVIVSSASISGAGFTIIGGSFPITLNQSQTASIQIQFLPTSAGAAAGQLTISSNSLGNNPAVLALTGTGIALSYSVNLTWDAPSSSPDPVSGYNIYRSVGSAAFQLINSSLDSQTNYVDNAVTNGTTYNYLAKSVDSEGVESDGSNEITVTIP
jgi:hypothetical protein